MSIPQSVSWWCFANRGVDDHTLLREIRRIGYVGVELAPVELFPKIVDAGFRIVSHSGHESIDRGLNNPAEHDRIEREIRANIELASKWNIPNLIVFSGNRRPGLTDAEGVENTVDALRRVESAARETGVTLILELLNSRVDHVGYQADTSAWGIDVCRRVDSSSVKLLYDIYHMQVMEGDLIANIRENSRYYAHYHTAGCPGRHDLDDDQEINYPAVIRAIRETRYAGFVGQEFLPKGDPIAALEAAFRTCA